LIGLETGSVRMARQIMPSKGVPFSIDDWPSVVLESLRVANQNNWFPMMTLMVGNPGETDQDVQETLDLVYEMERRGLFAFLIPSIFTPLHDTRMEAQLAPRPVQLVGSDRLEGRILVHVALPSPQIERAQFHLAADDVRRFGTGKNPSGHGQDSCR
jgi:radical SAM superfamily enzyme YgiQ (UPF0313 family)